jgi:predicted nucleic acid-binding protein
VVAATLTQNPAAVFSLRRDPKDEPYLNLAIEQHAPFLVTRDKDLLDLMKDDTFRKTYAWLTILDPASFLNHVRAETAKNDRA